LGKASTITVDARDPDGDALTYRWTTTGGVLANTGNRQTTWTAPQQPGNYRMTVTVSDGKGGQVEASTSVEVVAPPKKEYSFEDVHFEFDRFNLRPDAVKILDDAVATLKDNADLKIQIEGHTCNIGTTEYNLALGERRAGSVREYLISRGVDASRLSIISYGEEKPKYDNSTEANRKLNRRAALVVRIQ
jgi:peptidoglycan-associated lipoprotein